VLIEERLQEAEPPGLFAFAAFATEFRP